jgi:hypothetical protein
MNWNAVGSIGEVVAAFGVILSVLYLAIQVRKDARARVAETSHSLMARAGAVQQILSENRALAAVWRTALRGDVEGLDEADRTQFEVYLSVVTRSYEDGFYQYREGYMGEMLWQATVRSLSDMARNPGYVAWWQTRKHWYSNDFQAFVDGAISND